MAISHALIAVYNSLSTTAYADSIENTAIGSLEELIEDLLLPRTRCLTIRGASMTDHGIARLVRDWVEDLRLVRREQLTITNSSNLASLLPYLQQSNDIEAVCITSSTTGAYNSNQFDASFESALKDLFP